MSPEETTQIKHMSRGRKIGAAVFLTITLGLAGLMFIPSIIFGYDHYVVVGSSMSGSIDRGSLIFTKQVPVSELKRGDVITYMPPPGSGPDEVVTHRIAWMGMDRNGGHAFRTKGDANKAMDPWKFTLDRPTQAREVFHLPLIGYAFAAMSIKEVRIIVIGLPAVGIAIAILMGLWRESGKHRDSHRETAKESPL